MSEPRTLGHFRLIEKIGAGGMGVVYRAEDERLQRVVAVKVLHHDAIGDEHAKRRLLREARAAAAVAHPNIATIFEVGDEDGQIYVAMELVEGTTLRRRMREGALPLREILRVARDIAAGLSRAHDKRIVHRDLKPDNVMISEQGEVKILDFGLAKTRDEKPAREDDATVSRLTQEGDMIGTPAYMAPEQITGDVALDERADVFAFGVLLYEMLAGERPFKGATTMEIIASVLRDEPAPPSKSVAVPAELDALVLRCLSKEPAARLASARQLREALDRLLASGEAGDVARTLDAHMQSSQRHPPKASSQRVERSERPGRGRLATVVVLGLAVVVAGGVVATRRREPTTATSDPSAKSSDARQKKGGGLLDLPAPACNAAGQTEYRAGLRALHDIGWSVAEPHLRAAVKADPECAEAHLRLSLVAQYTSPSEAREEFQRARSLRARLGERERAILDAMEPALAREPPDFGERRERFAKLVERFPDDAEIQLQGSVMAAAADPARALALAQRAREIDGGYADAHQVVGRSLQAQGDFEGARRALDACTAAAPAAVDCMFERIYLDVRVGDCASVEAHARAATTKAPNVLWPRAFLAAALAGRGAARVLVTEVLQPYWSQLTPDQAYVRPYQRANIAVLHGDFAAAAEELESAGKLVDDHRDLLPHALYGARRLELLAETNDPRAAARVASELAERLPAWSRPPILPRVVGPGRYFEPRLVAARPLLPPAERVREMTAWHAWGAVTDLDPVAKWAYGDAMFAETEGAAKEALSRMPPLAKVPSALGAVDALVGRALLVGGRPADAVAPLRAATARCDAAEDPFVHTQAHLWLGQALEATDAREAACEAYAVVLRRWGDTKPASVSAALAKKHATKLACPLSPAR